MEKNNKRNKSLQNINQLVSEMLYKSIPRATI